MKINVFIEREKKKLTVELDEFCSLKDLFEELNINPVTVIATRNDELIPENEKLNDNDEIKLMPVISGG